MENLSEVENTDVFLPLSSLKLLVPPLRLLSAAMWQVAQRRDVLDYEKLDEFVSLVTASVPDLLSPKQRGKLLFRLRAKVVLELCRSAETASVSCVRPHLERIRPPGHLGSGDAEVDAEEAVFVQLIQTLLNDPAEREHFYQEVFPAEYDVSYDADMQLLVWEFLSKLESLLPVPDLGQTVSWLTFAPSLLEDMPALTNPDDVRALLQHHSCLKSLGVQGSTVEMSTQVFTCSECPFFHMQESYLLQHIEHSHPEHHSQLQRTAPTATKKPPRPRFPQPFPIHDRPDPHACPDCGKTFTRTSDMTRHQRTHTGERPYTCEECTRAFKNSWDLSRHQRLHTGERPFLCSQYAKRFTQMGLLQLHFERTACGQSCNPPLDLTTEVVAAAEEERGRYRCQKCGESFSSVLERLRHRQSHVVRRRYKCSLCDKVYSCASDLKRHQMKHTGARPFSCECGKSFTHAWLLNKHGQTHARGRPYVCAECAKSFAQLQTLHRHLLVHSAPQPFQCPLCEKSFRCSSDLNMHAATHTGEKPHSCLLCGKGFLTPVRLRRHMRTHVSKDVAVEPSSV